MQRDSAVAIVAQRLGNRADLNDRIISEMQLVQQDLEQGEGGFLPWFLVTTNNSIANDPVSTDTIFGSTLTGFLLPVDDVELEQYVAPTWLEVHKVASYSMLQSATPGQFNYDAQIYALRGEDLILAPDPGKVLNFRWSYYKAQPALDLNIENAWLLNAAELVIAMTCVKMAPTLQMEPAQVQGYAALAEAALTRLDKLNTAKFTSGTDMVMQYGNGAT